MSLLDRLNAARSRASNGGLPVRRNDATLYAILSDCLSICEDVERDGLHEQLRDALRVEVSGLNPAGRGRKYAERDSDACVLVCRYVLEGRDNRNSTYRYASTLREAMRRQIGSGDLAGWLTENGGVRALFLSRPVDRRTSSLRTLHLKSAVTVPLSGWFSVTLQWDGQGYFDVKEATP